METVIHFLAGIGTFSLAVTMLVVGAALFNKVWPRADRDEWWMEDEEDYQTRLNLQQQRYEDWRRKAEIDLAQQGRTR